MVERKPRPVKIYELNILEIKEIERLLSILDVPGYLYKNFV